MSTATGVRTALEKPLPTGMPEKLVMQTLAHELRQPLSAMESIAYYLDLVLARGDQRARDHALRLHGLVEQANWILSCALEMALDPSTVSLPVLVDLTEMITQTIAAHLLPGQTGPDLHFAEQLPLVVLDPARGRVMMANLLALFDRLAERPQRACVTVNCQESLVVMDINAQVDCENPRELTPKELSWGAGGTMGLESMRRVALVHGGDLMYSANSVDGYRARLCLPAGA